MSSAEDMFRNNAYPRMEKLTLISPTEIFQTLTSDAMNREMPRQGKKDLALIPLFAIHTCTVSSLSGGTAVRH